MEYCAYSNGSPVFNFKYSPINRHNTGRQILSRLHVIINEHPIINQFIPDKVNYVMPCGYESGIIIFSTFILVYKSSKDIEYLEWFRRHVSSLLPNIIMDHLVNLFNRKDTNTLFFLSNSKNEYFYKDIA